MIIFPAIDIIDKKCVRLSQGDYAKETVYNDCVLDVAKDFEKKGAEYLHIVDLDGALKGSSINFGVIEKVIKNTKLKVEVGGGIRSEEGIKKYIEAGADRISIGTKGVKDFPFLKEMILKYPFKISLSLDVLDENIRIKGWTEDSGLNIFEYLKKIEDFKISSIVVTDISKDGMLGGPNFDLYKKLKLATKHNIVVSGGISKKSDVEALREDDMYGVIVGKALYEGRFNLEDIL